MFASSWNFLNHETSRNDFNSQTYESETFGKLRRKKLFLLDNQEQWLELGIKRKEQKRSCFVKAICTLIAIHLKISLII